MRLGAESGAGALIERQKPSDRDDVVEMLVEAFWDYPVMRFILGDSGSDYDGHIRALIGFFADRRFALRWPVIGVRVASELAAVALVNDPEAIPLPESHIHLEKDLRDVIGESAWQRMTEFESGSEALEPGFPHYFVGMLGVRPGYQGSGLSRLIMDEIVSTSANDSRSMAVCLSTESPANLPFYAHLGFEVTGEEDLGELHTWSLMRATP